LAAARRHWRFIVRDPYGYVIQNAWVYVYQPGTTTDFVGSAFDAVTGGNALTNPFTTNVQGEVEGWFTVEQGVDVFVTSNSGTAYRAVNGSGSPVTFTSFTEKDEIFRAPENLTKSLWLPGYTAGLDAGTSGTVGTTPNLTRVLALADAATQGGVWMFTIPDDFVSLTSTQIFWIPGSTDGVAHTVRWDLTTKNFVHANGLDVTAAGTTTTFTGDSATRTVNLMVVESSNPAVAAFGAPGVDSYRMGLRRIGADGADSYVGVVNVWGVLIRYLANQ
jgi:hypothetical protein